MPSPRLRLAGGLAGYGASDLTVLLATSGSLWTSAIWPVAVMMGVGFTWRLATWRGNRRRVGFTFLGALAGAALLPLVEAILQLSVGALYPSIQSVCTVLGALSGYLASRM